jgi:hypothetical protein
MNDDLASMLAEVFWIFVFAGVPAGLLWNQYGLAVGVAYFPVAAAALAISYDTRALRQMARQEQRARLNGLGGS